MSFRPESSAAWLSHVGVGRDPLSARARVHISSKPPDTLPA
jgi:hypothetical protein